MSTLTQLWRQPSVRRAIGLGLLLAAFVAGSLTVGFDSAADEGDKLAIGLYILRGSQLYRDFFTHHLPFTYYWVALALALMGPTFFAVRLSVLFAQVLMFALLMRQTGLYLPLGLAAIGWELTRFLYLGQMATYNSLSALALAVLFVTAYSVLTRGQARRGELIQIGLMSGVLALCDPTAALAAGVAIPLVCLARDGPRRAATVALAAGGIVGVYAGWLLLSGTLPDFYRDVVVFNTQVYNQYSGVDLAQSVLAVLRFAGSALGIFRPDHWMGPDGHSPLIQPPPLLQWLFGGLVQRLAFLLLAAALLLRRRFLATVFVYLFAAALLPRTEVFLRQGGLMLGSGLAAALLAPLAWRELNARWAGARADRLVRLAVRAGVILFLVWPIVGGAFRLQSYLGALSYGMTYDRYKITADEIRLLTCGRPALLGYYPGDPGIYFFTDLKPVSRYIYMWPWVAQVALPDEVNRLSQGEVIVRLEPVIAVWSRPTTVYLADVIGYVVRHYVAAGNYYYLSPQLAAHCPPPVAQRNP